jgi:hypothetical protein
MDGWKWWWPRVMWLGVGLGCLAAQRLRVFLCSESLDPEVVKAR